ncbi:hypothetical protein DXG01_015157 [Tephrocybe rancida]|nr:hypothetical protein DXG01_015157 [Tephrocybe rancida]
MKPLSNITYATSVFGHGARLAMRYDLGRDRSGGNYTHICYKLNLQNEHVVTVSPSKPILAESAEYFMPHSRERPALRHALEGQASTRETERDCSCASAYRGARTGEDSVRLVDFLNYPSSTTEDGNIDIEYFLLSRSRSAADETRFQHARVHLKHFRKVTEVAVFNLRYPTEYMARGVAIISLKNERYIDISIPVVFDYRSLALGPKTSWTRTMLGIFDENNISSLPILRLVFSLASPTPAVTSGPPLDDDEHLENEQQSFTAYDIWYA